MVHRHLFCTGTLMAVLVGCASAAPQTDKPASADEQLIQSIAALQSRVDQLSSELTKMRGDDEKLRAELLELRQHVNAVASSDPTPLGYVEKSTLASDVNAISKADPDPMPVEQRVDMLEEKLNEQYQTKVESGSKYRVSFSGLILLNLFTNRGNVDSIETPAVAVPLVNQQDRNIDSIGGTLRQTELGFAVNGPNVFGARSSGNVQFDFAGGFTPTPGGETMGVVRLRTGTIRLDWQDTSFVAGQDDLFFAPLSPTSYASVLQPPLAYAGELWGWIPQARIEHRFGSSVTIQAGILDPLDDQIPDNIDNGRDPGAGEQTRRPGFGTHIGWSRPLFGHKLSFGGGGYYGRQQYAVSDVRPSEVSPWLGSADWQIPLSRWFLLSGSIYRGSALGGLAGGLGQSVVVITPPVTVDASGNESALPSALVKGLNTEGGWSQLKIQPWQKLEFNFAVGDDNPFASQFKSGIIQSYLDTPLSRNRAGFGNMIYRPRSDLLLSWEFRHIESYPSGEKRVSANQANLGMGIMF